MKQDRISAQKYLGDPLANCILRGDVPDGVTGNESDGIAIFTDVTAKKAVE